jgi:sugar lactone lactonase YvrE
VDGVQQGSTQTMSDSFTSRKILMMTQLRDGGDQVGYVSDARVIKGTALYTSNFTPPTAPLNATAVEGSAYSLNNASYEFKSVSVGSQATLPTGVQFNTDGTKMYVIDFSTDDIFQYSLSTAFDVSTASYDSVSFDGSSQETSPQGLVFSSDGTKMYTVGQAADSFFQYSLSTAFDLSTASYASKSFSVASQDLTPTDLAISADGTKMYMIGVTSDSIFEYDLSTAFDVSTASYNSVSLSLSAQDTSPRGLHFSSDGTKMFVAGDSSNSVLQYTLTTGFDLSTASYDSVSFSIGNEEGSPTALTFNADGTKFYILGTGNDTVYQYSVSTVSSLMLNFQDAGIYDRSGINNIDTVGNAQIDTAVVKYGTGSLEFDGSGDYLKGIAPDDELNMGTGDWTIEGWYYVKTRTTAYPLIIGNNAPTYASGGLAITHSNNDFSGINHDKLTFANYNDISTQRLLVASSAHNLNQWYHFALVRNGTNITMYRDGTSVASKTISSSLTYDWGDVGVLVGGGNWDGAGSYSDAYYDDLRITKGVARYTSNFTPPDAALPKF